MPDQGYIKYWRPTMRLLMRSQAHAANAPAIRAAVRRPAQNLGRDERRAWIEALFGEIGRAHV